jgi:hypothetical protein
MHKKVKQATLDFLDGNLTSTEWLVMESRYETQLAFKTYIGSASVVSPDGDKYDVTYQRVEPLHIGADDIYSITDVIATS